MIICSAFRNQLDLQWLLLKKAFRAVIKRNLWAFVKFAQFCLYPMDTVRILEYPFLISVLSNIVKQRSSHLRIIDVSSPKIISFLVNEKFRPLRYQLLSYKDPVSENEVALYNSVSNNMLLLNEGDATDLVQHYNQFDVLYSISVVEHIPNDGDVRAIDEYSKVVVNGGYVCITVPYGHKYEEHYDSGSFSHRWYSFESIQKRLFHKHLKLCFVEIVEEQYPGYYYEQRDKMLSLQKYSAKWQFFLLLYRYYLGYRLGYYGFPHRYYQLLPIKGVGTIHMLFRVEK